MTAQEKVQYFGNHLGCEIRYPDTNDKMLTCTLVASGFDYIQANYKRKKKGCIGDELSWTSNGNHNSDALHASIVLKPTSQISQEQLIKLAELHEFVNLSSVELKPDGYYTYWVRESAFERKSFVFFQDMYLPEIDYLRSEGIAIPWGKYSVEDLIKEGVLILKK